MGDLSKSKLSKTVALLCVVILLGSLLTGCGIPLTAKQLEDQSSGAANDSATTNPPADSTTGSTNSSENGSVTTPEINGSAATVLTSDTTNSGQAYRSDQPDQNALRIENGAQVTLSESTVQKTGDSTSVENSAFYGLNAGILVRDGGVLTLSGGIITTNATGATGLFVYNSGSLATVSNCTINTSSNNSGGIQVAGGGQISANNLSVTTQGNSAPALRSDRGGGNIIVDQGIYTSNGIGSPAIYCTANILVSNARLAANNSEAVVIDGANV
ncbi:MAG: hypothetical protein FWC59_01810, partial [Actinomycetia bacterium]|nr:hypothetical protein [Actinomycetes bacterium]